MTETIVRTVFRSDEFTCPSCVRRVEDALMARAGVAGATVNVATGRVVVDHDPSRSSVDDLVAAIRAAGYRVTPAPF
jgi:copper chaperone